MVDPLGEQISERKCVLEEGWRGRKQTTQHFKSREMCAHSRTRHSFDHKADFARTNELHENKKETEKM